LYNKVNEKVVLFLIFLSLLFCVLGRYLFGPVNQIPKHSGSTLVMFYPIYVLICRHCLLLLFFSDRIIREEKEPWIFRIQHNFIFRDNLYLFLIDRCITFGGMIIGIIY
jgi:hypothetical protein